MGRSTLGSLDPSPLIAAVYESLHVVDGQRQLLTELTRRIPATSALSIELPSIGRPPLPVFVGGESWIIETYACEYAAMDPLLPKALSRIGYADADHHLLPRRHYESSIIYNEFLRRADRPYLLGAMYSKDEQGIRGVSLQRDAASGPFGDAERALLQSVVPHLNRRARLERMVAGDEWRQIALQWALERMPYGVLLLDGRSKVLALNPLAERILTPIAGVRLLPRLRIERSSPFFAVGEALEVVQRTDRPQVIKSEVAGVTLRVAIASFPTQAGLAADRPRPAVAICVSEGALMLERDVAGIMRMFGLTRQEARVAALLGSGCSVAEIAMRLRISQSTARTYIKSTLQKTGSRRQSELVRQLLCVPLGMF